MGQKSAEIRKLIVSDVKINLNYREIVERYDFSKWKIMKKKFKTQGNLERKPGSGRPRKTSAHTDRQIYRIARSDPDKSCRAIKEELNLGVTSRTVSNRLRDRGLLSFYKLKKPLLRKANIKKRLDFARKYASRSVDFWKTVVWTDESKFELKNTKRRQRTRCLKSERLQSRFTQGTVKHGGGSLLVWGCFSWNGVGNIVRIDGKMTGESYVRILEENLKLSLRKMNLKRYTFQQDNDPKHTSKTAKAYFRSKKIKMLEWPPQSPDLNPIEHLWTILDDKIPMNSRKNLNDFWQGIQTAWDAIPQEMLQNLVESMPKRLMAVINNRGGHTKY
jgi:transposase